MTPPLNVVTGACRLLFARTTSPPNHTNIGNENVDPHLTSSPPTTLQQGADVGSIIDDCAQLKKKEGKRRMPPDVEVMVRESFVCCKTSRCVERFVTGAADINELRKQQDDFRKKKRCKGRTAWVATMVPFAKQRKNQGSMRAGDIIVCNKFFCQAFGVSNSTIDSAKRNPCSSRVKNNR